MRQFQSWDEAKTYFMEGRLVFGLTEMDECLTPITSLEMLQGFTYDLLYTTE